MPSIPTPAEIDNQAKNLALLLTLLGILAVGTSGVLGFLIGAHDRVTPLTDTTCVRGLDQCNNGLAECSGKLAEIERIFNIPPVRVPPPPAFTKVRNDALAPK